VARWRGRDHRAVGVDPVARLRIAKEERGLGRRERDVEDDFDGVANLQRAHQPQIRLDPPLALSHGQRPAHPAIRLRVELEADLPPRTRELELAAEG
jgi:hypothetical protein